MLEVSIQEAHVLLKVRRERKCSIGIRRIHWKFSFSNMKRIKSTKRINDNEGDMKCMVKCKRLPCRRKREVEEKDVVLEEEKLQKRKFHKSSTTCVFPNYNIKRTCDLEPFKACGTPAWLKFPKKRLPFERKIRDKVRVKLAPIGKQQGEVRILSASSNFSNCCMKRTNGTDSCKAITSQRTRQEYEVLVFLKEQQEQIIHNPSNKSGWTDLPVDVLTLILGYLPPPENIIFGSICHSSRIALNYGRLQVVPRLPWLILKERCLGRKLCFFDLSYNRVFNMTMPSISYQLNEQEVKLPSYGWLVVECEGRNLLINPLTNTSVQFQWKPTNPNHTFTYCFHHEIPNDKHGILILWCQPEYFLYYVIREKKWYRYDFEVYFLVNSYPISYKGKLYALCWSMDLVVVEFFPRVKETCIHMKMDFSVPLRTTYDRTDPKVDGYALVESCGQIMAVRLRCDCCYICELCFSVYKQKVFWADLSEEEWKVAEGLNDQVLYVTPNAGSVSVPASAAGGKANHIYYLGLNHWIEYDVGQDTTRRLQVDGYEGDFAPSWFLPSLN